MCGYFPEEALGCSPKDLLQGELTDSNKAKRFAEQLTADGHARTTLVNYSKFGRAFVHTISSELVMDTKNGASYFLTESEEAKDSALVEAMYKRQSERAAAWRRLQLECDEFLRPIHLMLYAALLFFCFVLYLPSQHGGTPTETPEVFTSMDSVGEYIGFHLNPGMGGFYP